MSYLSLLKPSANQRQGLAQQLQVGSSVDWVHLGISEWGRRGFSCWTQRRSVLRQCQSGLWPLRHRCYYLCYCWGWRNHSRELSNTWRGRDNRWLHILFKIFKHIWHCKVICLQYATRYTAIRVIWSCVFIYFRSKLYALSVYDVCIYVMGICNVAIQPPDCSPVHMSIYPCLDICQTVSPPIYMLVSQSVHPYVAFCLKWCVYLQASMFSRWVIALGLSVESSNLWTFNFAGVFGRFGLAVFTMFACSGLILHLLVLQILRPLPPDLRHQYGELNNTHLSAWKQNRFILLTKFHIRYR